MSKLKKLIKSPQLFLRDFLIKKYPLMNCEQGFSEMEEQVIMESQERLLAHDAVFLKNSQHPVDVVFTWVNNKDPVWQRKYQTASKSIDKENTGLYGADESRFEDHHELYYSVIAVKRYMPWVRKIFIVTDGQTPEFIENSEGVFIVDHEDIIDKNYLPTFNSHVIEACLHRIEGLSENFIYFNDDVFVARDLSPGHFFMPNGLASIFIARKSLSQMSSKGVATPTLGASLHSRRLLSEKYSASIDNPLVHTYVPLKKSAYDLAWKLFEKEINSFLPNKIRGNHDLNMATFLVPWLMYIERQSAPAVDICYYFNIRSAHALTMYSKLLQKKSSKVQPHSFCANDFHSDNQTSFPFAKELEKMLFNYYKE